MLLESSKDLTELKDMLVCIEWRYEVLLDISRTDCVKHFDILIFNITTFDAIIQSVKQSIISIEVFITSQSDEMYTIYKTSCSKFPLRKRAETAIASSSPYVCLTYRHDQRQLHRAMLEAPTSRVLSNL